MCGIVAYIGKNEAFPILIKGLQRLEYRGYDSSGVALLNGSLNTYKRKGKVADLLEFTEGANLDGSLGIGHTRWATHGKPDDNNAHPHLSGNGRLALVHNGIIENYDSLRTFLEGNGHVFKSETDTEVLVQFIEFIQEKDKLPIEEAVRIALSEVVGAYAIAVVDKREPNKLIGAKKASPLVVGIGPDEFYLASDATPIVEYTKQMVYLEDEQIVCLERGKEMVIRNIENEIQKPIIQKINLAIERLEKGGYDYFMEKEIFEQPNTVADSMRGRLSSTDNFVRLGGMHLHIDKFKNANRILIVACGTSWHAAMIGEYLLEDLARIPVEVEYASEFRYRNPIINADDLVIVISQSGETADTLAALELAKSKGAFTYGIVNQVGSTIARATHAGSYIHAGPEIGVASTKAFTGQVTILSLMALYLARERKTMTESDIERHILELEQIPSKIAETLETCQDMVRYVSKEVGSADNALYLGRGYNFPVALEGALKLKEISYIHAEGYPAAEMKHGPIALIDEHMPVFVVSTNESAHEKIVSNIQEVKSRNGVVIAIVNENDKVIPKIADFSISIPSTLEPFTPLLSVLPLQLLSYHIAVQRGCNVDQPRNLAKSVTVE